MPSVLLCFSLPVGVSGSYHVFQGEETESQSSYKKWLRSHNWKAEAGFDLKLGSYQPASEENQKH